MAGKENCGGEAPTGKKGFGGGSSGGDMKKGPWTSQEDEILTEYVKKHGEGNWNAVQKNSGLLRCGKSCRLRWANHLRPNLKKGAFSPEEEKIIIELHAKLGNKWARMAAQLPGRTDNEIKNYWNTRLKRRQRAGLPIYPRDVEKEATEELRPKRLKSSSSSFETFLSPAPEQHQKPNCTSSFSVFADPINFSGLNQLNSVFFSKSNPQFRVYPETNNYALPISCVSPFQPSASPSNPFNQNVQNQVITVPSVQFNSITFNNNVALNPMIVGGSIEGLKWGTSNDDDDQYVMGTQSSWGGNGGLLDALLQEECKEEVGKQVVGNLAEEDAQWVESAENQRDALSSSQSSIGMKGSEDKMEEMNSMDEDLQSLLNNFPSSIQIPVPEWYNGSSRQSSSTDDAMLQTHQNANSTAPVQTSSAPVPDLNWSLGSCCWNNMPGIC